MLRRLRTRGGRLPRRAAWALIAVAVLIAVASAMGWLGAARVACWQALAPRTPFGTIERVEFRVDGAGTLAAWDDGATVADLTALGRWTDRGLGYATRCTEGSDLHLVYITEAGRELDLILPVDDCYIAEPAWSDGRAAWEAQKLLERLGELLEHEPTTRKYALRLRGAEWGRD
ncbi:MAG TPA: hypothetical protein DEP45_05885 [Armatimonadetes bacterium]|nr:hypothetical protein [Armatimonadota bacterium]